MSDKPKVLIVEDSAPQALLYQEYLSKELIELSIASTGREAQDYITKTLPDLILLDLKLPDMHGQDILHWMQQQSISCFVIVITAHSSVDVAVDLIHNGADDFLEKPVSASRLKTSVKNLLKQARLKHMLDDYQDTFERKTYHGFIGASLPMQAIYRIIDAAAPSKATVFITGESGTGKEVCAEAIHAQGLRATKPFVAVNCGAIPHDLMESEIFGHVKGAFTGAYEQRKGLASQADGGSLFLDEIGEMSLDLQTKLLRFIQTGKFQKVGGSKLESVDVRFICATNRDPLQDVADGRFREDLYYRLHVVPLHLPPLRERGPDIIEIASQFLVKYAREEGKAFNRFSVKVAAIIQRYDWPGNIRQLQNVIRNIVVLNQGEVVELAHLPAPLNISGQKSLASSQVQQNNAGENQQYQSPDDIVPLAEIEKQVIERAINICNGNIPKAAILLDVSPSTIYRKRQAWQEN